MPHPYWKHRHLDSNLTTLPDTYSSKLTGIITTKRYLHRSINFSDQLQCRLVRKRTKYLLPKSENLSTFEMHLTPVYVKDQTIFSQHISFHIARLWLVRTLLSSAGIFSDFKNCFVFDDHKEYFLPNY